MSCTNGYRFYSKLFENPLSQVYVLMIPSFRAVQCWLLEKNMQEGVLSPVVLYESHMPLLENFI